MQIQIIKRDKIVLLQFLLLIFLLLVGEVLDVVRELKTSGMTLVLSTHEMGFARDISDLVCVLDGGHIIEQGLPSQVFSAPQSERAQQFLERIIRAGRL